MLDSISKYISQEMKNNQYRKSKMKRTNSILAEIRFMSENEKEKEKEKEKTNKKDFDDNTYSTTVRRNSNEAKRSSHVRFSGFVTKRKQSKRESQTGHVIDKIKKNEPAFQEHPKEGKMIQMRTSSNFQIQKEENYTFSQTLKKLQKISKRKFELKQMGCYSNKNCFERCKTEESYYELENENIHMINSLVRGAYEDEFYEFSDSVNLKRIDKFKKEFYTFNQIYDAVLASNIKNKMSIKDVKEQKMKDIVFINEQKNHASSQDYLTLMKKVKVIR